MFENKCLKKGVSGILRIKNEEKFIASCVESCISGLDELIIVYNDCTDRSVEIIEQQRLKYPEKILVYQYDEEIYSNDLTLEEYEKAKALPDDSPHLLCNYYNFALSKVNYQYAIKIDADQFYFTNEMKYWCNLCREDITKIKIDYLKYLRGYILFLLFVVSRKIFLQFNRMFFDLSGFLCGKNFFYYKYFAEISFLKGNYALSFSGINVLKDKEWFVSLGYKNEDINILPPFNGENDHLLFKVSESTYYRRFDMPYYNLLRSSKYSLIEEFIHPYKVINIGFLWFHLNSMRECYVEKVLRVKKKKESCFVRLEDFLKMRHSVIVTRSDRKMYTIYQRIIFSWIYETSVSVIRKNKSFLSKLTFL